MGAVSWACGLFGLVLLFTLVHGSASFLALGMDRPLPIWLVSLYVSLALTTSFSFVACIFYWLLESTVNHYNSTPKKDLVAGLLLYPGIASLVGATIGWAVTGFALIFDWDSSVLTPSGPVWGYTPEDTASLKAWILFFLEGPAMLAGAFCFSLTMAGGLYLIGIILFFLGAAVYECVQNLDRAYENWAHPTTSHPAEVVAMLPPQYELSAAEEGRIPRTKSPPAYEQEPQERIRARQESQDSSLVDEIASVVSEMEDVNDVFTNAGDIGGGNA